MMALNIQYLTPEELCDRWRGKVTVKTLANWRSKGEGPDYTKAGGAVLYRLEDIHAYEEAPRRTLVTTATTPQRLFDGEPARHYAAHAVDKACRGEDAWAYLDQVDNPAKRELAKAQARASFALIRFYAHQAMRMHPADVERYILRRVPKSLQPLVPVYLATLRKRAGQA
jgi:hypothetical protein